MLKNDSKHHHYEEGWIVITRRKPTIATKKGEDGQLLTRTNSVMRQKIKLRQQKSALNKNKRQRGYSTKDVFSRIYTLEMTALLESRLHISSAGFDK